MNKGALVAGLGALALTTSAPHIAVGQAICGTVHECAQAAVEAAQAAQVAAAKSIPSGAIMAFRLTTCPLGWVAASDLAGRVVVGAGHGNSDLNKISLTERRLGQTGGEEAHKLLEAEMPSHTHTTPGYTGTNSQSGGQGLALFGAAPTTTKSAGGDQPHNTMPPFLVLTYCEKK